IPKVRITKAVTKGIQHLSWKITVSPLRHRVVFKCRELIERLVEGYRQPTARTVISGEHLRYGSSTLFSRIPRFDNCWEVLVRPINCYCDAAHHNQDNFLFFGKDLFE